MVENSVHNVNKNIKKQGEVRLDLPCVSAEVVHVVSIEQRHFFLLELGLLSTSQALQVLHHSIDTTELIHQEVVQVLLLVLFLLLLLFTHVFSTM
jgi:hypothetical protein